MRNTYNNMLLRVYMVHGALSSMYKPNFSTPSLNLQFTPSLHPSYLNIILTSLKRPWIWELKDHS